ncbi:hypothetical protein JCM6882_009734 [Rhodosporidiobolus microsporus]
MDAPSPGYCCVCGTETEQGCSACAEAGVDLFFCSREHQKLVYFAHKKVCGAKAKPFYFPPLSWPEAWDAAASNFDVLGVGEGPTDDDPGAFLHLLVLDDHPVGSADRAVFLCVARQACFSRLLETSMARVPVDDDFFARASEPILALSWVIGEAAKTKSVAICSLFTDNIWALPFLHQAMVFFALLHKRCSNSGSSSQYESFLPAASGRLRHALRAVEAHDGELGRALHESLEAFREPGFVTAELEW